MKSPHIITIVAALWMGLIASAAQAATTVTDEPSLRVALKAISDQKATSDTCGNESCFLITIANSFTITAPVVVPNQTHLVGDMGNGSRPTITAKFGTSVYQSGGVPAIFSGDQITLDSFDILTSITEETPAQPTEVDAVRLKSHGSVTNLEVLFQSVDAPGISAKINGIFLTGDGNEIYQVRVVYVNGVGLIIAGTQKSITSNQIISTDSYGILILTKDPGTIENNVAKGKLAFGFSPDGIIPADQVAKIILVNDPHDLDPNAKIQLPTDATTLYATVVAKPSTPLVPKDASTPPPTILPLAPMSSVTPTGGASCSLVR